MYLDVELCDLHQNVLTRLDNRRAGTYVELGLNAMRQGFCPLSLEDPARAIATAIDTVLRITLKADGFALPLFIGRIIIPQDQGSTEEESEGLFASDPLFQLNDALIREVTGAVWGPVVFATTDQSAMMWALIAAAEDHGVVDGDRPASVNRDRTYTPGKEVGPALIEMSEVIDGPDFELEPFVAADGALARFNTFHPRQGSDLSDTVVFEFGGGDESATAFSHSSAGDQLVNRVLVIGAPREQEDPLGLSEDTLSTHPAYVAEHAASIAEFGVFEKRVQLEDVTEAATLREHAESLIAAGAFPIPYFDFTAAPERVGDEDGLGVPPIFGRDYWLGDTIGCRAWLGGYWTEGGEYVDVDGRTVEPLELTGRVTDAKVIELEAGQVAVKVTCAPEVSADGITGEDITVLVPEGEE